MLEDKQQHQTKPTTPSHRPESQPTTETGQPRPNSALTEKAEEKTNYFEAFWQHGLRLQTQDRHFSLAFHGYIFVDSGFTHEDSAIKRQIGESEDYAKISLGAASFVWDACTNIFSSRSSSISPTAR